MSTLQSASASTLENLNQAAIDITAKYGLNFNQGKINSSEKKIPLQYGEIEFKGFGDHRSDPPEFLSTISKTKDLADCRRLKLSGSRCCKRRKVALGEYVAASNPAASTDDATSLLWQKAGGDFTDNPHLLEDDFLCDDGISVITADDYVFFRFMPLIQYHTRISQFLTVRVQTMQICQFALTAILAGAKPLKFERWVPFFVALITAVTGTLEFENYPARLRNINQSLECLKNLRIWWQSLSMVERRLPKNKELLVIGAEATADSEISAWKKSLKTSISRSSDKGGSADHKEDDGHGEKKS